MLRKTKTEGIVDFAFGNKFADVEKDKKSKEEREDTIERKAIDKQRSKKLTSKDDGYKTAKHVSSIGRGGKSEEIQPAKYLKSETADSIWGPKQNVSVKKEIASEKEIDETVRIEKRIADRREADKIRMSDTVIRDQKITKVSLEEKKTGYDYKVSNRGIGVFETDFNKIPEKTDGEKLSEDVKKRQAEKDESWKKRGKALSSKDLSRDFINKLFES